MNDLYLISFVTAFVLTVVAMPFVIRLALGRGIYDHPDERKIHDDIVPRIGGIVFMGAVSVSTVVVWCLASILGTDIPCVSLGSILLQLLAVLIIFVVGMIDDLKGLKYRDKFIAQFVAGLLLCSSGLYITNFHGILSLEAIPAVVGWIVTIFAVIYCTNAINFIDGVDGQASAIALTAMCYYAWLLHGVQPFYSIVCVAVAGALIAFLRFNIWGSAARRTKTFMGDTGSLFLGLGMTFMGIVSLNSTVPSTQHDSTFVIAFAPLFMPCLDVVRVVIHRVSTGHSPFAPDMNHIHHKLLALGMSQHAVSFTVVMLNAVVIAMSYFLAQWLDVNAVILLLLLLWTILNVVITRKLKKKNNNTKS